MTLRKHWMLSLALMAAAVSLTARNAKADEVYKGTFTLPEQAYWGATLLPAGQYTLSVDATNTRATIIYLNGEGIRSAVIAGPAQPASAGGKNNLKLEEVDGAYVVRELQAGLLGKSFEFGVAKGVGPSMNVPVSGSAGI